MSYAVNCHSLVHSCNEDKSLIYYFKCYPYFDFVEHGKQFNQNFTTVTRKKMARNSYRRPLFSSGY